MKPENERDKQYNQTAEYKAKRRVFLATLAAMPAMPFLVRSAVDWEAYHDAENLHEQLAKGKNLKDIEPEILENYRTTIWQLFTHTRKDETIQKNKTMTVFRSVDGSNYSSLTKDSFVNLKQGVLTAYRKTNGRWEKAGAYISADNPIIRTEAQAFENAGYKPSGDAIIPNEKTLLR